MKAAPVRPGAWLWLLVSAAMLSQTALNLVRPVTTYKLLALDAGPLTVGLVTAVYAVLPLVSAMWLGRLSGRVGKLRHMMICGLVVLALGAAGIAIAGSVALVAAGSALLGLGHLVFTITGQSAIARRVPDDQLEKGFGWFTAAYSAGQTLGPLMAGLLLGSERGVSTSGRAGDITLALWIAVGLSLLAVPILHIRWAPRGTGLRPGPAGDGIDPGQGTMGRILRVKGVRSHMLASLALLGMMDILIAFLPLVGELAGVPPTVVGLLLAIRGGASIISRIFLPWLSHQVPRRVLLLASLYGSAVALAFSPLLVENIWLAGLCLFAGGFFLGLGQPLTMSLISTSVHVPWRGTALAVRLVGNRLGQVAMPLLAGFAAAGAGPAGAIWISCALLVASGIEKSIRR